MKRKSVEQANKSKVRKAWAAILRAFDTGDHGRFLRAMRVYGPQAGVFSERRLNA